MDLNKKLEEIKPYQLNCNVFDVYSYNGLTMQDLLCQFFTKINECISVSNETIDLTKWLVNEGLEIETASKVVELINNGTFENLINERLLNNINDNILNNSKEIEIERKRIDGLTKLGEGSTTGDAELLDIRIGIDGKLYNSAGSSIRNQLKRIAEISPNRFNGNKTDGCYLDENGNVVVNLEFSLSDYIEFKTGEVLYTNTSENIINYYDKNKNRLGSFKTPKDLKQGVPLAIENIEFIRIAFSKNQLLNGYVGSVYDNTYPKYGCNLLGDIKSYKNNKKIFFDGDSITEGYILNGSWFNYPTLIKNKLNCYVENIAESGRGFCVRSQRNNQKTLYETIQDYSFQDSVDNIIYLSCGVNDYLNNIPLGDENDDHVNTFYGSVNKCIELLFNKYPKSNIIFALPIHYEHEENLNDVNKKLRDYVFALNSRLKYYGVITNNLWDNFGYNPKFENIKNSLFDEHGLHPYTIEGTELLAERVLCFLKSKCDL